VKPSHKLGHGINEATQGRQRGCCRCEREWQRPVGDESFICMTQGLGNRSFFQLTGTRPRVKIVDIGANPLDGTPPYSSLLQAGDADVVGFEPNPNALATLNTDKGPHETYLPHAIGNGERCSLQICQAPGMTSLLEPDPAVLSLFHGFPDWGRVMAREDVETMRLDDIPETGGVDYIKIDIQGGELMALSHATARLAHTLVIQTEVEFLPLYKGQPLFSEVEIFLRAHGFMLHRFFPAVTRAVQPMLIGNSIYNGLEQLVWADAIFIRDITRLDALGDMQLLKMSRILHDCYQAYDLVLHILQAYDRRSATTLSTDYLAGLTR
jgi:FkbM family methyltransferase